MTFTYLTDPEVERYVTPGGRTVVLLTQGESRVVLYLDHDSERVEGEMFPCLAGTLASNGRYDGGRSLPEAFIYENDLLQNQANWLGGLLDR